MRFTNREKKETNLENKSYSYTDTSKLSICGCNSSSNNSISDTETTNCVDIYLQSILLYVKQMFGDIDFYDRSSSVGNSIYSRGLQFMLILAVMASSFAGAGFIRFYNYIVFSINSLRNNCAKMYLNEDIDFNNIQDNTTIDNFVNDLTADVIIKQICKEINKIDLQLVLI